MNATRSSAGAWAARGTTTGAAAYAYKSLSPTQSELYTDFRFKVVSQGNVNVALVRFRTSTGAAIFSILRRNDGKLHYYNEITGAGIPSATVITTGVWHELKVHGLINGTAGLVEVWLDGIRLGDVSRTDNLGTNPIGRVYLGDPGTGKTWDIAFDEVVVSTSADVTPPLGAQAPDQVGSFRNRSHCLLPGHFQSASHVIIRAYGRAPFPSR